MAVEEKDALIDEIFEEITTSPRAPRATRENIEKFDAETGEILEGINPRLAKQGVTGTQTEAGRSALMAAVDIMIEREEADEYEHPHHLKTTGGDESGTLKGSVEDHRQAAGRYPESQTDGNETVTVVGAESGTVVGPKVLDGRSSVAGESRHHCDVSEDEAGQTLTGNFISEISPASQGEAGAPSAERVNPKDETSSAAANTGGDHVASSVERAPGQQQGNTSNNGEDRQAVLPNKTRVLRPHCQSPDMCGSGTRDHCWTCKKAMQESAA